MENEGIIIGSLAYGDSDLILRVLGPECGKVVLMARGARKSSRRFSGGLEIFDYGVFLLKSGRGSLPLVASFVPKRNFLALRSELGKLSCASFLCELFDLLIHEGEAAAEDNQASFELLHLGLQSLCESDSTKTSLRCCYLTLLGLLEICGILPDFADENASAHALMRLIAHTEESASRELKSKAMLLDLVDALRKERAEEVI